MNNPLTIYASWDAWSCNTEYWQSHASAIKRAYELAADHVNAGMLADVVASLADCNHVFDADGLTLISVEEIEVKE